MMSNFNLVSSRLYLRGKRIATLADAILDRLVHNAHRITLRGESLRKKNH